MDHAYVCTYIYSFINLFIYSFIYLLFLLCYVFHMFFTNLGGPLYVSWPAPVYSYRFCANLRFRNVARSCLFGSGPTFCCGSPAGRCWGVPATRTLSQLRAIDLFRKHHISLGAFQLCSRELLVSHRRRASSHLH